MSRNLDPNWFHFIPEFTTARLTPNKKNIQHEALVTLRLDIDWGDDMRELTSFELALVSGGDGGCEEASGEEINICAPPPGNPPPSNPPPTYPPSYEPPIGTPPSSGGPTPETPCEDAHSDKAADNIRNLTNLAPNHESKEYLSAIYKDSNGDIKTYGPIQGNPVGAVGGIWEFPGFYTNFTSATGQGRDDIVGEVHNHPFDVYGHDPGLNMYPSTLDWVSAENAIAAGANPATYSLYVIDTVGDLREFPYTMKDFFKAMSDESKRLGLFLPAAMTTVPTPTCG